MKHHRRHLFLTWLLKRTAGKLIKLLLRFQCDVEKGPDTPTIIIANHNTDLDPALVVMGFSGYIYFVASEHAFRKGFK